MMDNPGFLIWNPMGGLPRVRHDHVNSAKAEAKRLAKANPGEKFFIMMPVAVAHTSPAPVRIDMVVPKFDLSDEDLDSEIPF